MWLELLTSSSNSPISSYIRVGKSDDREDDDDDDDDNVYVRSPIKYYLTLFDFPTQLTLIVILLYLYLSVFIVVFHDK